MPRQSLPSSANSLAAFWHKMVDNVILESAFDTHTYEERKIKQEGRPSPKILFQKSGSKSVCLCVLVLRS